MFVSSKRSGTRVFGVLLGLVLTTVSANAGPVLLEPYGFVRLDVIVDDAPMQNHQFPVLRPLRIDRRGGCPIVHPPAAHARRVRLANADDEPLAVRGQIEADFQNGGSESRQTPRMRHAFVEVSNGTVAVLAGQTWDVVAPLWPAANNDGLMWNAGNLGDRRPQVRVTVSPRVGSATLSMAASAGMTSAVDQKDLDDNGVPDGMDAAIPSVQGRVGVAGSRSGKPYQLGAWGHWATERVGDGTPGETDFTSWAVGGDVRAPLLPQVAILGEAWMGENLSDIRGGIGQGVNPASGDEIASKGGWAEIQVAATSRLLFALGGSIDDPEDTGPDGVGAGGRTQNRTAYGVLRYRPVPYVQWAIEYVNWKTTYRDAADGTDNRLDLHTTLNF